MKKLITILLLSLIHLYAASQTTADLGNHFLKVYRQAMKYNDANTAISALHNYIVTDNNIQFKDTLSMLYFSSKSYYSSLLLAEEVRKAFPENINVIARAAECFEELGDSKSAASLYEKVIAKTKNPYATYKLAICQYQLNLLVESEVSARAVLADTSSSKHGVNFTVKDGSTQVVSTQAAAANLIGVLRMGAKKFSEAKAAFELALKLYPAFTGAKENLDICTKRAAEKGQNPSKNR